MPEVQEVFRMATQKVRPDPDALERQHRRQRSASRTRKVGAFAVAASIAAVGLITWATLRGGDPQIPAGSPSQTATGGAVTHYFVDVDTGERTPGSTTVSDPRLLRVSPDGTMFAYNTCCTSFDRVWVANIDGTNERAITPTNLNGYAPSWSPDGSTLVFQGRTSDTNQQVGQLYLADVVTGELTTLTDLEPMNSGWWIIFAEISPDGRTVLFHLPRNGSHPEWDLWTIPITGGTPTLLREDAGFGSYGPDGTIVFLDHPEDLAAQSIWLMDADGSNARVLVEGGTYWWPEISPDGTRVAYEEDQTVFVAEVATGRTTEVTTGQHSGWFDDDTLILSD